MNPRPSGYEPDELPDCSTPRLRKLPAGRHSDNLPDVPAGTFCAPETVIPHQ